MWLAPIASSLLTKPAPPRRSKFTPRLPFAIACQFFA